MYYLDDNNCIIYPSIHPSIYLYIYIHIWSYMFYVFLKEMPTQIFRFSDCSEAPGLNGHHGIAMGLDLVLADASLPGASRRQHGDLSQSCSRSQNSSTLW